MQGSSCRQSTADIRRLRRHLIAFLMRLLPSSRIENLRKVHLQKVDDGPRSSRRVAAYTSSNRGRHSFALTPTISTRPAKRWSRDDSKCSDEKKVQDELEPNRRRHAMTTNDCFEFVLRVEGSTFTAGGTHDYSRYHRELSQSRCQGESRRRLFRW